MGSRLFDYASAKTISEAIVALNADGSGNARALAGETDRLTLMKAKNCQSVPTD